jgi:hypothetical protein
MAAIQLIAVNEECPHCHSYVSEKDIEAKDGETFKPMKVCGDCALKEQKKPGTLMAEKHLAEKIAEGRRRADEAAKKAFLDEMRKLNEEEVTDVVGEGSKSSRVAEAN